MTPEITVTPSNYRWLLGDPSVAALATNYARNARPPKCWKCKQKVEATMQYPHLFRALNTASPEMRESVRESVKRIMRLSVVPRCRFIMGTESFYL